MSHARWSLSTFAFVFAVSVTQVQAESNSLRLPSLFGDHMVLQRDKAVPVWGKAAPDSRIKVSIAEQTASGRADKNGVWKVQLAKLDAGGPHALKVESSDGDAITFKDVLVGEVWLCSGQSNMAWPVNRANAAEKEIASAKFPRIRLISVRRNATDVPQEDFTGSWSQCSPQTVAGFSAVGYFFGRRLHKDLDVPIGLINSSVGGTPAESWTSRPALKAQASLKPLLDRWEKAAADYDPEKAKARYEDQRAKWEVAAAKAKKAGKRPRRRPRLASPPKQSTHYPGMLFNGKIAPLIPFAMRGAVWYQGESNASRAFQYRTVFPTLIRDWRKRWGNDFPFIFVQLANFREVEKEPGDSTWAELREAQSMTLRKLSNTGQAVITDIGEANDIHPRNKQDVGKRLALWALANTYGKQIEFSGPSLASIEVLTGKIEVRFNHSDGLTAKEGELKGFAIAGEDRKFVWADAKIVDGVVHLSHKDVANPIALRYAWANNPVANLYNAAGLPASPFRTDNWPGITEKAF